MQCATCSVEGQTGYNFPYNEWRRYHDDQDAYQREMKQLKDSPRIFLEEWKLENLWTNQTCYFYNICEIFEPDSTVDYPYNVDNVKKMV